MNQTQAYKKAIENISTVMAMDASELRLKLQHIAQNSPSVFNAAFESKQAKPLGVMLIDRGERYVKVIKELRGLFKISLKDAKDLSESAPCRLPVRAGQARAVYSVLKAVGANVTLITAQEE